MTDKNTKKLVTLEIAGNLRDVPLEFANDIPINYIMNRIEQIMKDPNQTNVLILQSETGSGKSVIMPPELHSRFKRSVYISEPTVLTAQTIPDSVVSMRGYTLGKDVGYRTGPNQLEITASTGLMYMTTKVLTITIMKQQERSYKFIDDVFVIMDEAHLLDPQTEQLLALLKATSVSCLTPKDPFIIITSATIVPEKYATYMNTKNIIRVKGSVFEKKIVFPDNILQNPEQYVASIIQQIMKDSPKEDDIMIFCSTPTMMKKLRFAITKKIQPPTITFEGKKKIYKNPEKQIIDFVLLASLDVQQHSSNFIRYMKPLKEGFERKIILATPVAETGVTIPTLKYVFDMGYTCMVYLDPSRNTINILPNYPVAQDAFVQRIGRIGRTQTGVAYAMYPKAIYENKIKISRPSGINTDRYDDFYLWILKNQETSGKKFETFSPRLYDMENLMHRQLAQCGLINGNIPTVLGNTYTKTFIISPQEFKFLLLARAFGLRISDIATMLASLKTIKGDFVPSNDIIMDQMISTFLYISLITTTTFTNKEIQHYQEQYKTAQQINEIEIIDMFKRRQEFLTNMINLGINPFVGDSLYNVLINDTPDNDEFKKKSFDIIKRIKMCFFLSFIDNMIMYDDKSKSYISNKGIEISLQQIAQKLGNIVYDYPPQCIVCASISISFNNELKKSVRISGASSMDGFINVDNYIFYEYIDVFKAVALPQQQMQANEIKKRLDDYFQLCCGYTHPAMLKAVVKE